jgi:hypothetical protein
MKYDNPEENWNVSGRQPWTRTKYMDWTNHREHFWITQECTGHVRNISGQLWINLEYVKDFVVQLSTLYLIASAFC